MQEQNNYKMVAIILALVAGFIIGYMLNGMKAQDQGAAALKSGAVQKQAITTTGTAVTTVQTEPKVVYTPDKETQLRLKAELESLVMSIPADSIKQVKGSDGATDKPIVDCDAYLAACGASCVHGPGWQACMDHCISTFMWCIGWFEGV